MPYWLLVTRSFRIAWDRKYLWLIALFSGEGSFGSNYSYSQRQTGTTNAQPDFAAIREQATAWVNGHIGLIVTLAAIWLVLAIAFFILAAVCEGATIRASAEHDAERPFGLGLAWRMGVHSMWVIVRFRLLLLLLNLPLVLLIAGWVIGLVAALVNRSAGAVVPLAFGGLLILLVWLVYGTYLFFLDRLGTRAVVLEELKAIPAIARAHRLLLKRPGRALLVWLISIGVALVLAIALGCAAAVLILPFAAVAAATPAGGPAVVLVVLAFIISIPLLLVLAAFLAAQSSTYWTLAFRRLDLEYGPAYAGAAAPQT